MNYYIQTFGCQMNGNDSQLIAGLLESAGHTAVETPDEAKIIIVNTCCVRESAENRALGYIGSFKKLWETDPARIIVVCGCMVQKAGTVERFRQSYRHVGILIGTFAAARLASYIEEYAALGQRIVDVEERYDGEELRRDPQSLVVKNQWRAQVNINYGCNNFCSYCIVPYVRGRERSREPLEIIQEVQALAGQGIREIQLLGQNVNSYGKDFPCGQVDFAGLLTALNDISGIQRIRYMTSHPRDFDHRLADRIVELKKVCHHFHLPIQSGSDRMLKMMNRGYSSKYYVELLSYIEHRFPDATLTTDFIVGFPGETEKDFQQTLDMVKTCRFDAAYTFIYSRRSGTPAAEMPDQVEESCKKERLQRLMDTQNPISLEKNQAMVGRSYPVMVEGTSKNDPQWMSGRTDGNKIVVFPKKDKLYPGQLIDVRIIAAQTWNLSAALR